MEIKNGVLRGDLVCDKSCRIANCGPSLKIYGNVLIKGNLKVVPALTVYGTMIVQGKIDVERSITVEKELKVSALSMINGNLICDTLTLLSDIGDVNVLAAHTSMDLDGLLGNITARMINSQGSIYCDGRLIVTGSIHYKNGHLGATRCAPRGVRESKPICTNKHRKEKCCAPLGVRELKHGPAYRSSQLCSSHFTRECVD